MSIDSVSGLYVEGVIGGRLVSRDNPIPVNVIGGSVGGGESGGSNISLPTDANGNVLMNLNAIRTSQSLGVNITGSSSTVGVSLDAVTTNTSIPVTVKNASLPVSFPSIIGVKASDPLPVTASSALPVSGSVSVGNEVNVNVKNSEIPVSIQGTPAFTISGNSTSNPIATLDTGSYTLANQNAKFISGANYNKSWNRAAPGMQSLFSANNQRVRLLGVASEANQIFAFQKPNVFTIYFPCNVVIDLIGLQEGSFNGSATDGFCRVVNRDTVGILLMYWVYS